MVFPIPPWWAWDLDLSPHVLRRMIDRGFTEIELREMIEDAGSYRSADTIGRFILETRHNNRDWEVVVEPDESDSLLVVVTAYPVAK